MQKVWYHKSVSCWYATFTEGGGQVQLRLLKAPNDREHKKLAEKKLLQELKARPAAKPVSRKTPDWLTVRGIFKGFLRHSRHCIRFSAEPLLFPHARRPRQPLKTSAWRSEDRRIDRLRNAAGYSEGLSYRTTHEGVEDPCQGGE